MPHLKTITVLVLFIAIMAGVVTIMGMFTEQGPGPYQYESIRGERVEIYGQGLYKHMSAEVAIQGIAQDYITLFLGIPLLLIALYWARTGALKGRFLLAGTLGYFLVTYLFYLVMGMYNQLFLIYAFLLGSSFFAFSLTLLPFDPVNLPRAFRDKTPVKLAGGFLIFNAIMIGLLWLSIVVPPLLTGTVYPAALDHYTTLIVQGLDLGLLLPLAVVSGILLIRKQPLGYLLGPVYFVFLGLLMSALTAKLIAMGLRGYTIIPAIFIIPVFNLLSITGAILLLRDIRDQAASGY